MAERQFPVGTIIFKEGDQPDCAYVIKTGKVQILKRAGHGDIVLAELGPGAPFGEMGLFDGNPRAASARALETTNVDMIDAAELEALLGQCPPRVMPILRTVFDRLRTANQRLSKQEKATDVVGVDFQKILIAPTEGSLCEFKPVEVPVAQLPFKIGGVVTGTKIRDDQSHLSIPSEGPPLTISPSHFLLEVEETGVYLVDQGSRFGTVVNGTPIGRGKGKYKVQITKGDTQIAFGDKHSPYRIVLRCA
ncbi:MAG: cyclic nucleotide-binding domain-containing protein [Alphaproteobacteria bacterium]|nr:cyclic nucleotide-binding domain-containing protein [Alphaproteobacteria bacterium]